MEQNQELRILTIGDCNTSGLNTFSVPSILTEKLADLGYTCVLHNLGEAMNTSREGIAKIKALANPSDVVLINFGLVDAWITSIPWLYISYFPDNRFKKLGRKLLKSLKKSLRSPTLQNVVSKGPVVELKEFESNIRTIVEVAQSLNPKANILLWGTAPSSDEKRNLYLLEYDEILRQIALDAGVFLDTRQLLAPHKRESMYQDPVHLSREGSELIANEMLKLLKLD